MIRELNRCSKKGRRFISNGTARWPSPHLKRLPNLAMRGRLIEWEKYFVDVIPTLPKRQKLITSRQLKAERYMRCCDLPRRVISVARFETVIMIEMCGLSVLPKMDTHLLNIVWP